MVLKKWLRIGSQVGGVLESKAICAPFSFLFQKDEARGESEVYLAIERAGVWAAQTPLLSQNATPMGKAA